MKVDFDALSLNESPDAVMLVTPAGKIAHWSKGAQTIFGYAAAEAVGKSLSELLAPFDRIHEEAEFLKEALSAGLATF